MKFIFFRAVNYISRIFADILTALKGDGSFKADHRFVVYRLHSHDFIASGCPPSSVRPAIDHGLCLQPLNHILNGLGDMLALLVAFPFGTQFNTLYKVFY
jgi:hypothetical protein